MTRVKLLVIALVLDLTLFFNLERISFGQEYYHFINIQGFVYGVGILAVVSTLAIRRLRKLKLLTNVALWLGIYALGKFLVFRSPTHPPLGGFNTFITVAEVALVTLSVVIANVLAQALYDFEQAVENITLTGISRRLKRVKDAGEDIQTELVRSRRYHEPVSVIVVEPDPESVQATLNRAVEEVQKAMMTRYVINSMASVLTGVLRRTDMILEQREKGRFIIFSPETDASSSAVLSKHIESVIAERMHVTVQCGVAEFPDDALTFEELVRKAEQNVSDGHEAMLDSSLQAGKSGAGS